MLVGLVGSGGCGRDVMPVLKQSLRLHPDIRFRSAEVVFVEKSPLIGSIINGVGVMSEAEFLSSDADHRYFNIAIADSGLRRRIAERFESAGAIPLSIVSPDFQSYDRNDIGPGAIFCAGSTVTSNVQIGRFFHSNLRCSIAHDCVIGDFVTFAPGVHCNGNVHIDDGAFIGSAAVIRDGTAAAPLRIGANAVIGMGAIVTRDVPPGETWFGNPARKFIRPASDPK